MPADWMLCDTDTDRDEWAQEQARREEIAREERGDEHYRLRPPDPADSQEDKT